MDNLIHHPNGNISLKINLPWDQIKKEYELAVSRAISEAEIPGFRKGKAPRHLIEPKLDTSRLYSEAVQALLPQVYSQAVKSHGLKPILYPKISIDKAEMNHDWEFTATTCETPSVGLENYRQIIKSVSAEPKDTRLSRILAELQKTAQVKIPDLLVEEETDHRLSQLADNLTKMGLTTESYLHSKKITASDLKDQTLKQARKDLETEFVLEHIRILEKLENRAQTLDLLLQMV